MVSPQKVVEVRYSSAIMAVAILIQEYQVLELMQLFKN